MLLTWTSEAKSERLTVPLSGYVSRSTPADPQKTFGTSVCLVKEQRGTSVVAMWIIIIYFFIAVALSGSSLLSCSISHYKLGFLGFIHCL